MQETVKAGDFGFDEKDASECLQKAIRSRAKEVIINNTGKDWIIGKTISLVSNQSLTLEDGVVIRAAKGAFKKPAPMFVSIGGSNISIRGKGTAKIIMNRADYRNPKLYTQSEHRHIFALASVSNVTVRDLTLAESGGDGIYLGGYGKPRAYCQNVLIENVTFDGHNRLGLAVISGKDITIRNCRFLNAEGCPPQGGIDFEPNVSKEKMSGCLVENCFFENNKGAALSVAPSKLNAESEPVSVLIRNCVLRKNGIGFYFQPYYSSGKSTAPVKGEVQIVSCTTDSQTDFRTPVETVLHKFIDCTFTPPKRNRHSCYFSISGQGKTPIGNILFKNCILHDDGETRIFKINYKNNFIFGDKISGDLTLVSKQGKKKHFDFESMVKREQKRLADLSRYQPMELQPEALKIPPKDAAREKNSNMYFRGGTFLQYAEKGQDISMNINTRRCGYDSFIRLVLKSPSGKVLKKLEIAPGNREKLSFKAEETGLYRIVSWTFNILDIDSPHRGNGWVISKNSTSLIYPAGRLYFSVPAGVKNFAISIQGQGTVFIQGVDGERLLPKTKTGEMQIFPLTRKNAGKTEIFFIDCRKVEWDLNLIFHAPLQPVAGTNPDTLFR